MSALLITLLAAAPVGTRVELIFGGDVIPHDAVKDTARAFAKSVDGATVNHDGWDHVFAPLAETFRAADVAIVNLETPLSDDRRAVTEELVFNAPSSLAGGLKSAGVAVATFANNHCLDQHREGIVETRRHLAAAGLLSTGAAATEADAWQPLVLEKNGLSVCLFAFTRFLNGFHNQADSKQPHVPIIHYPLELDVGGISEEKALVLVRSFAQRCDALIVALHWGDEYQNAPNPKDRRFAWALLDAGATAIIGSHPHVLQPIEEYARADGRLGVTAYSLGNLVSNQGGAEPDSPRRDGLLVAITLEQTDVGVTVASTRAIPVWTANRFERGRKRNVQPMLLDDERQAIAERLVELEGHTDRVSRSEIVSLKRRWSIAERRRERILFRLPVQMYGEPPATLADGVRVAPPTRTQ